MAPGTEAAVAVHRASGSSAGDNDFYFIKQQNYDQDNQAEEEGPEGGANDTAAGAEALAIEDGRGYLLGFVSPSGDVDYWSFPADAGDDLTLVCGALRDGSGLEGATFTLRDTSDALVQTEVETATADVRWSDSPYTENSMPAVSIESSGFYYLEVSAEGQSDTVSSDFYRCGLYLTQE